MSRGYSKIYSRKPQTSIQFDKLFQEKSNRPSAAKSAGTVGKWGVISCTSLRSTNYFDDTVQSKYTVGSASKPVSNVVKPKKFFKSHNIDVPSSDNIKLNASVYSHSGFSNKKYGRATYGGKASNSKKTLASSNQKNSEQTEAMNLTSPHKQVLQSSSPPQPPEREENKPPIVLRIFKRSQTVNDSESQNSTVMSLRSSRRRSSELQYVSSIITIPTRDRPQQSSDCTNTYKTSNKEEIEESNQVEASPPTDSTSINEASTEEVNATSANSDSAKVCLYDIKTTGDSIEEELEKMHDDKYDAATCDSGVACEGSDIDQSSQVENMSQENLKQEEPYVEMKVLVKKDDEKESSICISEQLDAEADIDMQDKENILKAQDLLAETYVDFNSATQKILDIPTVATVSVSQSKVLNDNEFSSDSEDSGSMREQSDTVTGSQTEQEFAKMEEGEEEILAEKPEISGEKTEEEKASMECTNENFDASNNDKKDNTDASLTTFKRKGCIFKSRQLLSNGSKKRLALYKHKWYDDKEQSGNAGSQGGDGSSPSEVLSQPVSGSTYSDLEDDFEPNNLKRVTTWPISDSDIRDDHEPITSVKCAKKVKGFYTVVRNVKKAHQIQESGEFQEFNDDVEYILDTLQDNNPIGTRCLSAITLASKCMAPAFRMHVRAHGIVSKFFRALHDATKDQSLGLCTATVMFVLSQDQLNMDLDRHSLELMLNLLESDVSHRNALDDCGMSSAQLRKNKQKVRELCEEIQSQGHAKHLNLDNITVGQLAMETLLSLTSRRAGEWFKEELRELGGLDHIVNTVCECCRHVNDYVVEWTDPLLDRLRKVDRCLRVLENVSNQNEENQLYLLKHADGILLATVIKLFRQCDSEIQLYPVTNPSDRESVGVVIREVLFTSLKVLANLTHDYNNTPYGSSLAGQHDGIIDTTLHVLFQATNYIPEEKKFDMHVLALILLSNLVEFCKPNRKLLFEAKAPADPEHIFQWSNRSAVEALIAFFYQQEELAKAEEEKTDAILDGKKDSDKPEAPAPKTHEEFIEETISKLLQKAGRNMEHTLLAAYIVLLLGYLIHDNEEYEASVRQCLPSTGFEAMIAVLRKVYDFMNLTASAAVGTSRGLAQAERVIKYLSDSDIRAKTSRENEMSFSESSELDLSMPLDVSKHDEDDFVS